MQPLIPPVGILALNVHTSSVTHTADLRSVYVQYFTIYNADVRPARHHAHASSAQ